jgi:hypothetical protein
MEICIIFAQFFFFSSFFHQNAIQKFFKRLNFLGKSNRKEVESNLFCKKMFDKKYAFYSEKMIVQFLSKAIIGKL